MELPDKLLKAAIEATEQQFRKKNLSQLTSGSRHAVLASAKAKEDNAYKFELITWLLIK
jgi:hypothetical protein